MKGLAHFFTKSKDIHKSNIDNNGRVVKTVSYPKSAYFVIINEFFERLSFYGVQSILSFYLIKVLLYTPNDVKIVYHAFGLIAYLFPIFGAIISDSFLGKFRTIFVLSIIYALGNIILSLAATKALNVSQEYLSIAGLVLIAVGSGGIKPCISSLGGDQFDLPDGKTQLNAFFFMFYFVINCANLFSTFLSPVMADEVHCFGEDTCYPLGFTVTSVHMLFFIVFFLLGKPFYKVKEPKCNIIVKMTSCIGHALITKCKSNEKKEHWLDYSEPTYGRNLVDDVKVTLKILILYLPLPVFWALFNQQGSAWTLQAAHMNNNLGFYTIPPSQMQVLNPLIIMVLIPVFTYCIYPLFAKCYILRTPLQRMVCGGFMAAAAFATSGCLSLALEATYPTLPTDGNAQIRIYNTLNCNASISHSLGPDVTLPAYSYYKNLDIDVKDVKSFYIHNIYGCDQYAGNKSSMFKIQEKKSMGYLLTATSFQDFEDNISKDDDGSPKIRTLVNNGRDNFSVKYMSGAQVALNISSTNITQATIKSGTYTVWGSRTELTFNVGGVYTVLLELSSDLRPEHIELIEVTEANSIHILWLLPQYVMITIADIMFSITGVEFSYSQAPDRMKTFLQASFYFTVSFGNLIVVIIESARIFDQQSSVFFLYTSLMVVDMLIFTLMAIRYKDMTTRKDENPEHTNSEEHLQNPSNCEEN